MNSFLIVTNNEKDRNIAMANRIIDAIETRGGYASRAVMPHRGDKSPIEVAEDIECVITVGGDGTVIRTAQRTFGSGVPLLGVNMGHLGYLCDVNKDNLFNALDKVFDGDYTIEERMMLEGNFGGSSERLLALNDVVLSAPPEQSIVNLAIHVNGMHLYSFNGDGLILSTPTGSTAYNLSAHGPVVEPKTQLIVMTPINPHTLNSRSIILDSSDEIMVEMGARRSGKKEYVNVVFDGTNIIPLYIGEKLYVRSAAQKAKLVKVEEMSFLERIKARMQSY